MNGKNSALCSTILAILLGLTFLVGGLAPIHQVQRYEQSHERQPKSDVYPVSLKEELIYATALSPTQVVSQILEQINRDRALNDIRQLTGEEPICVNSNCYTITNRRTSSEGLGWAMDYLYENLVGLGYSVEFQDWSRSGYADRNLIAKKLGELPSAGEVYFVAHVDGVKNSEEHYPAADDNASSVVGGLELARVLSSFSFSRTVVLLFSTGEEQGMLGVQEYINQLSPSELNSIRYVMNGDMIGYDGNGDGVMELYYGNHSPSLALAQMMSETIDAYQLDLDQRLNDGCG